MRKRATPEYPHGETAGIGRRWQIANRSTVQKPLESQSAASGSSEGATMDSLDAASPKGCQRRPGKLYPISAGVVVDNDEVGKIRVRKNKSGESIFERLARWLQISFLLVRWVPSSVGNLSPAMGGGLLPLVGILYYDCDSGPFRPECGAGNRLEADVYPMRMYRGGGANQIWANAGDRANRESEKFPLRGGRMFAGWMSCVWLRTAPSLGCKSPRGRNTNESAILTSPHQGRGSFKEGLVEG